MISLRDILAENPVIAAVRCDGDLNAALKSNVKIVFVLYGSVLTIPDICKKLHGAAKTVFIHIDMIEGLKGDAAGIEFIRLYADPIGIVSTKANAIKCAKQLHFETILRIFLVDSLSLKTGVRNIRETSPDAVEVMPGIACRIMKDIERQVPVPVIAGGLIVSKEQVYESLSDGAIAISTSARELWSL